MVASASRRGDPQDFLAPEHTVVTVDLAVQAQFLLGGVPQIVVRVCGLELLAGVDRDAFVVGWSAIFSERVGQRFQRIVGIA
jgi:hypothetical protein